MKHFNSTILAAAIGVALAPAAQAQLSANIGAVSNYVWRGMTQTDDGPAVQGGIDYAHESGLFIGTWASNVEFPVTTTRDVLDATGTVIGTVDESDSITGAEVDIYAGYGGSFGDFSYKATVLGYIYTDNDLANFSELTLSGTYGWLTVGIAYTLGGEGPDSAPYSGGDIYYYGTLNVPLGEDFSLAGTFGYYDFDDDAGTSVTNGQLGVSKTFGDFGTFGLNVARLWGSQEDYDALGADNDTRVFVTWLKTF